MPPVSSAKLVDEESVAVTPSAAAATRRLVRVEPVMGTIVSFDVRLPVATGDTPAAPEIERAIDAACEILHDIDARFSLYRPESELSRLARAELSEAELSADVRSVLAICDDIARTSGGAFDARGHRADGVVDPSGFVKGWAVEVAAERLTEAGARHWSIAAGGDVLVAGRPDPATGLPWRVGIRHPDRADRVAAVLGIRRGAVATSGLYERGGHIRDSRGGALPSALRSMTVVGPSLAWADAFATGAFVMGLDGLAWVHDHPGYGALAITADNRVVWTPVIDSLRLDDDAPALSATSQAARLY